jgi:hypothetical protein
MDARIQTIQSEYLKRDFKALEVAHADTIRLQKAKDDAQRLAAVRQSALARDLAANRDGLVRLSHAADSALRSASDSHEQCITRAAAFSDVFAGCGKQLVDLGATADRLASDKQALIESWPTSR